jgi:CBS domain-containing protein
MANFVCATYNTRMASGADAAEVRIVKIRSIMTTNPSVVSPGTTVAEAARMMRDRRIGLLLVIDGLSPRRLVGVITDHDVVTRCVARCRDYSDPVSEHMTREGIAYVTTETDVDVAVAMMEERCLRRLPVLDAKGRVAGVVTVTDLRTRLSPREPGIVEHIERRLGSARLAKSA